MGKNISEKIDRYLKNDDRVNEGGAAMGLGVGLSILVSQILSPHITRARKAITKKIKDRKKQKEAMKILDDAEKFADAVDKRLKQLGIPETNEAKTNQRNMANGGSDKVTIHKFPSKRQATNARKDILAKADITPNDLWVDGTTLYGSGIGAEQLTNIRKKQPSFGW